MASGGVVDGREGINASALDQLSKLIESTPFVGGGRPSRITVSLTGGTPLAVSHGLRRSPDGWMLIRVRAAAAPVGVVETASDNKTLTLLSSLDCTADLWVW